MGILKRMGMGWDIAMTSLSVLNDNRGLLLIPVLSGAALAVVALSFMAGLWNLVPDLKTLSTDNVMFYVVSFIFYFINYFIIIFFNVVLIHCATMALLDKPYSVKTGINVARTRLGKILAWSAVSATVGAGLKALEESGYIGEFVAAILGIVWSVMTFFIIPIIIYENLSIADAIKASAKTMKRTWGETLGAQFSYGLLYLAGLVPIMLVTWLLWHINPMTGVVVFFFLVGVLMIITTAANSIFVAATYMHTRDKTNAYFRGRYFENAFASE